MAMYVYKDKERNEKLYANNASKEDKGIRFYCPNPKCDAHMYICSVDGFSSAHFKAKYKQYQHVANCPFHFSNGFNPNEHDEDAFNFENAVKNLMLTNNHIERKYTSNIHDTNKVNATKKPLRTIRQIYDMCKSFVCTDEYNHVTIGQMLLDNRSAYMYPKSVFGYRIIEGMAIRGRFYDSDKLEIKIAAPITDLTYKFILKFDEEALFKQARNMIFANREKIIIAAGEWKPSGRFNVFYTDVKNKKQMSVINQ